jgi:hypothetical protein
MKYYSFGDTVIKCTDDTNWKDVVIKMRQVVNSNTFHPITIMIEDIQPSDEEEYNEYLKTKS